MLGPTDIQNSANQVAVETPVEVDPKVLVSAGEHDAFLMSKINEILGGDEKDVQKNTTKLQKVLEYAYEKGAKEPEDVLWEVRYLANRLGTPGYGESRLNFLHQYLYLLGESKSIEKKLKTMEAFNG